MGRVRDIKRAERERGGNDTTRTLWVCECVWVCGCVNTANVAVLMVTD